MSVDAIEPVHVPYNPIKALSYRASTFFSCRICKKRTQYIVCEYRIGGIFYACEEHREAVVQMTQALRNIEDFVRIFHTSGVKNDFKVLRSTGEFASGFRVLSPIERNAGIFYRFLDNSYYVFLQNEEEYIDKWVSLKNLIDYNPTIRYCLTDEMKKFYLID